MRIGRYSLFLVMLIVIFIDIEMSVDNCDPMGFFGGVGVGGGWVSAPHKA